MNPPTRILVVDDKEENIYYLQALLTAQGWEVDSARHGAEALVKARQTPPDLIVSDLLMPVMDGYTLLRHWKADARLKSIPFIVYTATYTEAEDERLALSLGADAFILKPSEPEEFLARIRKVQSVIAAAVPTLPNNPIDDEKELLKVYSETLIRKLEEKTLQLEEANKALKNDITSRMETEESLRESEERFRATFEQAAVGIAHVGTDGKFLRVNAKLCEITGYQRDEMLEVTFHDLTFRDDRAQSEDVRQSMLANEHDNYSMEKRYQRKDGRVFWGNMVTTLLRGPDGEPRYFISVIADITERKALQEQFLRAQRMEGIGTLASGIAHDLNNMLSPIMMSVEMLRAKFPDAEAEEILQTLQSSAQRGADLVKQVLSFARGVEGQRVVVNPLHILRDIEKVARDTFPKSVNFNLSAKKELWAVTGDSTQLHQVFLNLCVNARDSMPNGGNLKVSIDNATLDETYAVMNSDARPGAYVAVQVADTGTGIPPAILDRIFEPFFTTKEVGKGTGLGLSTTLAIVKSHGGFINVDSEPGQGTTFKVYLPANTTEVASDKGVVENAHLPRGHGELILVVDDEPAIRSVAQRTLERFGYRVLLAAHGAEATAMFARHQKDIAVVITDMAMPIMDGPALIIALKAMNPSVRIVGSSGHASNHAVAKTVGAGIEHFIPKPYTAEVMLKTLRDVIDPCENKTESRSLNQ